MGKENYIIGDEIYFDGTLYDLPSMNFEQKFLVLTTNTYVDTYADEKIIDAILDTISNLDVLYNIYFSKECNMRNYVSSALLSRCAIIKFIPDNDEILDLYEMSDEQKLELLIKYKNQYGMASKIIANINSLAVLERCPITDATVLAYVSKMHELKGLLNDELPKEMKRSRI